jgi:uncharacterized protein (TIGR02099 family)
VSARVQRLETTVGATIEHGVKAAERTIARRFGVGVVVALRTLVSVVLWTILIAYFAFGVLLLATRYWVLPRLDDWRGQVEALVSEAMHTPVTIGRMRGGWRAFNPHLVILDVRISGPHGAEALALPHVEATVSWASLFTLEPRFAALTILAPELEITRLPGERFSVAGFLIQPSAQSADTQAADWLLAQSRIAIRDARVRYRDERSAAAVELELNNVDMLFEQRFGVHRFSLQATPTAAVAAPIDVRGQFKRPPFVRASDIRRWRGEVYAQLEYADIAILSRLFDTPVVVRHAHGALRGWLAFDQQRITRVTADLALKDVDVTLAAGLAPLRLVSLQGRVSQQIFSQDWRAAAGGDQFSAKGLTFATAQSTFSPLDLTVRHSHASDGQLEQTVVEADRIDLTSLAALAPHLPLAPELRDALTRHAIKGTLSDVAARWDGVRPTPESVVLRAKFSGLSSASQPVAVKPGAAPRLGLPGFENLAGTIDIQHGNGTLQLSSKKAALSFPGVFAEPRLAFDDLTATLRWVSAPRFEVRIESARAANADADVVASGVYRATDDGPGWVDLTGRLTRGEATAAYRYVPLVAGRDTIQWVQHALVAGRASDATFRLRGDLSRFPFRQGDGEFRVVGRMSDGVLDVWPAAAAGTRSLPGSIWPLLADIDAELVFERASMTITAQRAEAMGARIGATVARIADLENDATLEVRGQASGAIDEMLRYANASPVVRWTGGITQTQAAAGPARLELQLQIPLERASESKVSGTLHFRDNDLTLKDLPPFTRVSGALHFNERGIRISGLSAHFLGAQTRIDGSTRADGAQLFTATGSITPAGLKRIVSIPAIQRLLDRTQGSARYQANLVVKDGTELTVGSDLVGLAIDGVAPLRKQPHEPLPLHFEQTAAVNGRDEVRLTAGSLLAVRLQRRHDKGETRIVRGVIALNEPPNLPDNGLLLLASAPRLDIAAWSALLATGEGSAPGAADGAGNPQIDAIALHTPELLLYGRTFSNVTLGATRVDDGYDANVVSDHVRGHIAWRWPLAGGADTLGRISARLSHLVVPESRKDDILDVLRSPPKQIPALELNVEQFELAGMKLGRLELSATNVGTGAAAAWRLARLDISNPDMRLTANGAWTPANAASARSARRMQTDFALDLFDAGDSLARFGYPATMSGGRGRLEGQLAWVGSPLDLDVPSLSGTVNLALDSGRFLKVEAGNAARLLSLLSLQSLSRALAVDGGRQFAEGFAYTSLRADAKITEGVLATENFRMTGPSAVVLMSGTANLRDETQALRVVVLPEIDASTAALALGVANPILGIGTYLAQLLLRDPLSKAFALEYDVTGPWAEPQVIRRRRVTPDTVESIK